MGSKMKFAIVVSLGLLALVSPAAAQSPVAVVEDVQGKVTGAEFMDYVTPKSVIKIGENGSIVLSYMNSCRREKISGVGTVIVGTEESNVHLAEVQAEKTNCDSKQANATTRQTSGVAATVLRSVDQSKSALPEPQLTLYGASPLVEAKGRGKLIRAAPRRSRRAPGDQSGRHPAQGKVLRFRQRERRAGPWRPLQRHVQVRAKSCSGSIRRPSPVRRRSSAACSAWNRRVGQAILRNPS